MLLIETSTAGRSSIDGSCRRSPVSGLTPGAKFSNSGPEGSTVRRGCGVGWMVAVGEGEAVGGMVAVETGGAGIGEDVSGVEIVGAQAEVSSPNKSQNRGNRFINLYTFG